MFLTYKPKPTDYVPVYPVTHGRTPVYAQQHITRKTPLTKARLAGEKTQERHPQAIIARTPDYKASRTLNYKKRGLIKRNSVVPFRYIRDNYRIDLANEKRETSRDFEVRHLALLLPGHNEELIVASTVRSAVAAGQDIRDIYVVDDCSSDQTRKKAIELLGEDHVLTVERSGKAMAVKQAIQHFNLDTGYQWLHVADADSVFGADYFRIYKKKLDPARYAVAVGFVQSLRGNWISNYRASLYTYGQHIQRRIQAKLGMIAILPGPITCFRTDILSQLDFEAKSLTEDFDLTLQIHRKKLGKIAFIPKAINYTQDPQTLRDFIKQNMRWYRGFFQGIKKYRIGTKAQRVDVGIVFLMAQVLVYLAQFLVLAPIAIATTGEWAILPLMFIVDFIVNGASTVIASAVIKRWAVLGSLPYFYLLRWLEIFLFVWAFTEVYLLGKFQSEARGWQTEGRRYKLDANALKDVAAA